MISRKRRRGGGHHQRIARRRGGGHHERIARRQAQAKRAPDSAWRHWRNPYVPKKQFSDDEIEAIHLASLEVLRDTGIRILDDEARQILKPGGLSLGEDRIVRFDLDCVSDLIGHAPGVVTLHARGEDRNAVIGGDHVSVCTTGGTPNFPDLEKGRPPGSLAALDDFCRLAQSFDVLHLMGPFVEPQDVPLNLGHLAMTRSEVTPTDKTP